MSRQEAEAALHEANRIAQEALQDAIEKRQALNEYVLEEEVEKQAVFFGVSEEEARRRINQNLQETAEGRPRTIWAEPNQQNGGIQ